MERGWKGKRVGSWGGGGQGETLKLEQWHHSSDSVLQNNRQKKELWASMFMGSSHQRSNTETLCLVTQVHTTLSIRMHSNLESWCLQFPHAVDSKEHVQCLPCANGEFTHFFILLRSSHYEIVPIFEKRLVHVLRLQTLEMIAFLFDSVQIHVPSPQTSPLDYRSSVKRD